MTITLEHAEGRVLVDELPDGRRKVTAVPLKLGQFMLSDQRETRYPLDLIELLLEVGGVTGLCDQIRREEDFEVVERLLRNDLFAYFSEADFKASRILDFGCGSGSSTVILARMFPQATITGVELAPAAVTAAHRRAAYYNLNSVSFQQSPSGTQLPAAIGEYDLVILSAVYEHLLPWQRTVLMPQLWRAVRDNGFLFINQTPNLLFPIELHTTMLPFINYLPDRLALALARRCSQRVERNETWDELLQKGIRGATEDEILDLLPVESGIPWLLEPRHNGLKDRIDLYYRNTNQNRLQTVKKVARVGIKAFRSLSGIVLVPDLSLAIQKLPAPGVPKLDGEACGTLRSR